MDRYFTTSDGATLHYIVKGNGKTPVVILPGMGQPAESFDSLTDRLGEGYTFYILDYRCHGKSEDVTFGYHTERLAADVKEMLDDANIGRFHLIAHSMGNAVSWAFFELYGRDRIISYVLEEEAPCLLSDPCWSEEESGRYRGNMDWPSFVEMDGSSVRSEFMCNLFHDHVNNDWRQEVVRINLPTLILMGMTSHYACPDLWNWLNESIPGSRLVTFDGGHNLHVDCEDGVSAEIAAFLAAKA